MIAQELRIGNYISRLDLVSENQRTEQILELLEKRAVTTGPTRVIVLYEEIKPIQLTEEWLLKFGFEKIGCNYRKCYDHLLGFREFVIYNKFNIKANNYFTEIYYVHQLQNLYFAFTEEELTIEN